ncbi:MAG TPA: exodeoxyribonuclease V subunit beta [bacterium]
MGDKQQFDLLNSPLEGVNLIEASAGTGKTYTITGLFLRLIVEKKLTVDQILVVTFTEAATNELKDRVRKKLREAIEAFSIQECEDSVTFNFIKKNADNPGALSSLQDALRDFDQAAIFTIHGFCQRMLIENAFESSSLFDTELVTDQENLKREIVQDFWRKHFYHASPLFVNYALRRGFHPDKLLNLLGNKIFQPGLKIIPHVEPLDSTSQQQAFQDAFYQAKQLWNSARPEVAEILLNDKGLNRNKYRQGNIGIWIETMDQYLASGENNPVLFDKFEKFTANEISNAMKNGFAVPSHPFFNLCQNLKEKSDELTSILERQILGLKNELFNTVREELQKKKADRNVQSFDDLLLKLFHALSDESGKELAQSIRKKYHAALIDEFQDTDPVQYAIFKTIFDHENSILFLIGDPKQAIYGFRGADIFAYMEASNHAQTRYTLVKNWRSGKNLVAAINTIFGNASNPFVYDAIPYEQITAAKETTDQVVFDLQDDKTNASLQLWFLEAGRFSDSGKPISKSAARELIFVAVSNEIARLIKLGKAQKALISGEPLKAADIAVLVRRNAEAIQMQQALSQLNVPSVLYSNANIFDSHEAMEMERVLAAIAEPNNEKLLKAALATDMLGISGEALDQMMDDEIHWESWLIKFRNHHETWSKRGFMRMFRQFLSDEKILARLMSLPDGERRNTNVLHLSEILHQASIEKNLKLIDVVKWLSEQRDPNSPRLEEHQLRLESDEKAVKIVTIHKSKGLEYPIVFCPFTWDGSKIKNTDSDFAFHDENDNMRFTLDLGSDQAELNRMAAEKELLAENLRLFYVALTRAKHRCYVVWGRINESETSAPAYIFHQPEILSSESIVNSVSEHVKSLTDDVMLKELKSLQDRSAGTVTLSPLPIEPAVAPLSFEDQQTILIPKKFDANIDRQWHVSSFSSLVYRHSYETELADYDTVPGQSPATPEKIVTLEPISPIFDFPGGRKAGMFFHHLFENLDFILKDKPLMQSLVADSLSNFGYHLEWQQTICDMIERVISVPLDPSRSDFTLSRISQTDRLNELEFYFPIQSISTQKLNSLFSKYQGNQIPDAFPEQIEKLNFAPLRGFMKGFIDMVFRFEDKFYLVDWKSNNLGNRVEDYNQKMLHSEMTAQYYFLQYYIYTVALDKYLKLRQPGYRYERDFGGVFYIFSRGIDPQKGHEFGVYRDTPAVEFIAELSELL